MLWVCNLTFITCVVGWWPLQSPSLDMGSRSNRDKSLFSMNFFSYVCLFLCSREVYCVHACLANPICICSIPNVPKVPPHLKVYREVRVMINEQNWSSSLSLTPCPWGGMASWGLRISSLKFYTLWWFWSVIWLSLLVLWDGDHYRALL